MASAAAGLLATVVQRAAANERVIRIGYRKYGTLILLKNRGLLEEHLAALGYTLS